MRAIEVISSVLFFAFESFGSLYCGTEGVSYIT
jgi:hypothetical protein